MLRHTILAISLIFASFFCRAEGIRPQYAGNVEFSHCFYWEDFLRTTSGQAAITTTHGVNLGKHIFTGVGVGLTFFYGNGYIGGHCPIFADVKYTFTSRRWRPFADMKAGYAYGSECGFAQPAIGIKYTFKDKLGLTLSFGSSLYFGDNVVDGLWCNGLNLALGFEF